MSQKKIIAEVEKELSNLKNKNKNKNKNKRSITQKDKQKIEELNKNLNFYKNEKNGKEKFGAIKFSEKVFLKKKRMK